jgi:hypothetical protein
VVAMAGKNQGPVIALEYLKGLSPPRQLLSLEARLLQLHCHFKQKAV